MQFTQGLHRAAQQKPDAVATVCGTRSQTFAQLHDRVARLAAGMAKMGVRRGDRIAILSLNSDRYLEAYLAIAWLGAVVNPLNFRWSTPEIVYSLKDSECTGLFIDDQFAPQLPALLDDAMMLRHVIFTGDGKLPEDAQSHEARIRDHAPIADAEVGDDELFGIFYTGGTTGASKGVMLSHRSICTSALALMAEGAVPEGAAGLHAAPMFHLADMMLITMLLLRGGEHVVCPAFKPDAVLDLIEQRKLTELLLVPAMLQVIADFPATKSRNTASVRRILYGAAPVSEALLDRVMAALPTASLMQVYGMTETAAVITVLPWAQHTVEGRRLADKLRSGGRAAFHVRVKIADDQDQEKPRGEVGEILARGPGVMQGYLNKAEATAAALKGGWMHTGDMGYMDTDGYVFVVDRLKDMIISGGENIYSVEVENAIARHPAVAANAVIGIPCNEMGEKVHAAVVLKPGASLTQDELYAHCKTLIAGYKCPRSVEIRSALPLSGAGKVLKTELRKPFWEGRTRAVA